MQKVGRHLLDLSQEPRINPKQCTLQSPYISGTTSIIVTQIETAVPRKGNTRQTNKKVVGPNPAVHKSWVSKRWTLLLLQKEKKEWVLCTWGSDHEPTKGSLVYSFRDSHGLRQKNIVKEVAKGENIPPCEEPRNQEGAGRVYDLLSLHHRPNEEGIQVPVGNISLVEGAEGRLGWPRPRFITR